MRRPAGSATFMFKGRKWYGWPRKRYSRRYRRWVQTWTCKPAEWPLYRPSPVVWLGAARAYGRIRDAGSAP